MARLQSTLPFIGDQAANAADNNGNVT